MYKKTSLYSKHIALYGKMVEFAGYEMPIQYSSIVKEHNMVREKCGLFDVSHMGIIQIVGAEAENLLQYIATIDVSKMQVGDARYSLMCYENGGCVDDILIYKAVIGFMMVVNAANASKDLEWINKNNKFDAEVINVSPAYSQIAIQGPMAEDILGKVININFIPEKNYTFRIMLTDNSRRVIIARTGYTGEDGFEIYVENDMAEKIWEDLLAAGGDNILPCGLGARDTLRLEAGMPLYGHELSADITPVEAGLKKFVAIDKKSDFIGKATLKKQIDVGVCRQRCFIELEGKGIAREGDLVFIDDMRVGYLTSGNRSITLGKSIGMAMVRHPHNEIGTKVQIQIRNKMVEAVVVKGPFYRRKK